MADLLAAMEVEGSTLNRTLNNPEEQECDLQVHRVPLPQQTEVSLMLLVHLHVLQVPPKLKQQHHHRTSRDQGTGELPMAAPDQHDEEDPDLTHRGGVIFAHQEVSCEHEDAHRPPCDLLQHPAPHGHPSQQHQLSAGVVQSVRVQEDAAKRRREDNREHEKVQLELHLDWIDVAHRQAVPNVAVVILEQLGHPLAQGILNGWH
mmetsp:Transcript_47852/g.154211  ORF Transcript_47852/g.154211 Transcript_47852/m.154211 type:complete len:204 (-) Transcript_47852:2681-3292(-)